MSEKKDSYRIKIIPLDVYRNNREKYKGFKRVIIDRTPYYMDQTIGSSEGINEALLEQAFQAVQRTSRECSPSGAVSLDLRVQ